MNIVFVSCQTFQEKRVKHTNLPLNTTLKTVLITADVEALHKYRVVVMQHRGRFYASLVLRVCYMEACNRPN